MNYIALKNLIETITKTYKCPECSKEIDQNWVDIMWTAGNTINIDLMCNNCWKHSIIKAELAYTWNMKIDKNLIDKIKNEISKNKETLKDKDIIELNNKLKNKNLNISDLF